MTLVARGEHLRAMQARGLVMRGATEGTFAIPATDDPCAVDLADDAVIVLAMKTGDTAAALDAAGDRFDGRPVMCFQNGVANEAIVAERGLRTYGCVVVVAGRIVEPGVVVHPRSSQLTIGCWPSGIDDVCERVVADLDASGMSGRTHPDVRRAKWSKLVRNLNNAYLALIDASVQDVQRDDDARDFMREVHREAMAAIAAAGIELEAPSGPRPARKSRPDRDRADEEPVYPSTWQDLHFRRPTVEVDYFNGEIVQLGEQHGIPTPYNRVLQETCNDAAARRLGPGSETTASLLATIRTTHTL